MNEKTIKSERIYEGKIINLRVDMVELPGRKYAKREIVEHSGAVAVLGITPGGKILLVKQFRKPVEDALIEIPAGKIEANEEPIETARRELQEETGYRAGKLTKMLDFYTSGGFSNEVLHLYLADDLILGESSPDEDEYVEMMELSLDEIIAMIASGEIKDAKTIIAIYQYQINQLQR